MIVIQASLTPGVLVRKAKQKKNSKNLCTSAIAQFECAVEPDDHYPLTCTPENGVWMLGNLNEYLPFFAFAWRRSEELESYDVL